MAETVETTFFDMLFKEARLGNAVKRWFSDGCKGPPPALEEIDDTFTEIPHATGTPNIFAIIGNPPYDAFAK